MILQAITATHVEMRSVFRVWYRVRSEVRFIVRLRQVFTFHNVLEFEWILVGFDGARLAARGYPLFIALR